MATHKQLLAKAVELGHEVTPQLSSELAILADVSDAEIVDRLEISVVARLARDFRVPIAVMEQRLKYVRANPEGQA